MIHVTTPHSSNIDKIGYEQSTQTLEITFRSGGTYRYKPVSRELWDQFINAGSVGKFFHREIKGTYLGEKVS
jgi:hypothetical protein